MSAPDPYDEHQDTYTTEKAVDLRGQRLRRQSRPEAETAPIETPEPAPQIESAAESGDTELVDESAGYDDPYAVGQDALAENDEPEFDYRFERETSEVDDSPATWGWRGRVNAAVGMKMAPKPDSAEVRFRQSVTRVQQPLPGCMVVSVISLKGDAGKTSTTLTLANTFGSHRHGVVAWDANQSTGTLGDRAANPTDPDVGPWDVLENARDLTSAGAVSGALGRFLRLQPTHDEVLGADTSTSRDHGIGWDECAAIMAVLRRHRDLIFIDTGNEPVAANWQWAVQHSNLLVVPLPLRLDMTKMALRMFKGIIARGFGHLVSSAIVLTVVTPGSDPTLEPELVEGLARLGLPEENVIRVPYEPSFATGERIVYDRLLPSTIEAYTNVAAEIADALAASVYGRAAEYADPYTPEQIQRPPEVIRRTARPEPVAQYEDRYAEYEPESRPNPRPLRPRPVTPPPPRSRGRLD